MALPQHSNPIGPGQSWCARGEPSYTRSTYVPGLFAVEDPAAIESIIGQNGFAILVSGGPGGMEATHVPLLFERGRGDRGTLTGHLPRGNRQWESFDGSAEALAIFAGPHAYISPSWYRNPQSVPTWDYVAVHAYGCPRAVSDEETVLEMLGELVDRYEAARPQPWSMATQDPEWLRKMAQGVVAFEMPITRIEAKTKLGQTRPAGQPGVAAAFSEGGQGEIARLIGEANNLSEAQIRGVSDLPAGKTE